MKKNKKKNWLVFGFIVLLVIILIVLISKSGGSKADTSLNLTEKRWIETNKKEVVNASIANNIPVFSNDGTGVFFDFLNKVEDKTGLSFNLISYDASSNVQKNDLYFEVIKKDAVNKLKDTDMVFYKDYYVLVGKENEHYYDSSDIIGKKIGVLSSDLSDVSFYIPTGNSFSSYEKSSDLTNALNNGDVNYIAVPKTRYYSYILSDNHHVVYNLTDLKEAYVLKTSKSADEHLVSIINKKFTEYKLNNLEDKYNDYLSSFLFEQNNISEKSKADFSKKTYTYGYLVNNPYTDTINNRLIGLDSNYLTNFSKLTGATFTYKKFRSVKDLINALNKKEIDLASNYYNLSDLEGDFTNTISLYNNDYVVLVNKKRTDVTVNSLYSLKDKDVVTL